MLNSSFNSTWHKLGGYLRALRLSVATAALLAGPAAPALADEMSEIKNQMKILSDHLKDLEEKQQAQQAAPAPQPVNDAQKGEGGLIRPFTIPGTNTQIKIGGYVKGDGIYDVKASSGDQTTLRALPLKGTSAAEREGVTRLHARQSRFNIETLTPTSWGKFKTFIEGDFFGDGTTANELRTGSSNFHLRHAWGELGPFLAGQTWSNFIDTDTYIESIDFSGPAGQTFLRQGQFRYTWELLPGTTWSSAVENPEGDFFANPSAAGNNDAVNTNSVGATTGNNKDKFPDFTTRFTTLNEWGKFTMAGVIREIGVDVSSTSNTAFTSRRAHTTGWGLSTQGIIYTHLGKDQINYQVNGGNGIGRYMINGVGTGANFNAATSTLETQKSWGFYVAYRHWWTDTLRSNAAYGADHLGNDTTITGTAVNKRLQDYHLNLIWSPLERTNFGVEYIYGKRGLEDGEKGYESRVQMAAQYLF